MIAIVDYGVGNLFSLQCSFRAIGEEVTVTSDPTELGRADKLILPGVGAFADAAEKLRATKLDQRICEETEKGKPLLGICLGMQLLLDKSYEYGEHCGLGLIPGEVRPIRDVIGPDLKVPHIGWNALHFTKSEEPLWNRIQEGDFVYFVHSYYAAECAPYVIATTDYGTELTVAVRNKNVWGVQFHPEKSGKVGLAVLKAFCEVETT